MIKEYFNIKELVCKHVYNKWKERAWQFLDDRLLENLLFIRQNINKPIIINNWENGKTQRGLRCNCCKLVTDNKDKVYLSQHIFGKAVDFDVVGMSAEEVRQWIKSNQDKLPHPCRLEKDVNWVHLDVMNNTSSKIIEFEAN